MSNITRTIFRAYDIRGTYPTTLNEHIAQQIGKALGSEALSLGEHTIIVGRDGRLSSPVLSQALMNGILSTGCHVIDIGIVPTPTLYFAAKTLSTHSGVMVTGSHNPPQDNGLKMVLAGQTLAEEHIQKLYHRIETQNFANGHGNLSTKDMIPDYMSSIFNHIHLNKKLKIVIDCSNGVAGIVAPLLFRQLGCEVIELFTEIDGHFPNHSPDPSQPDNNQHLIAAVKEHQADLGLIFDGDADRLGVISQNGNIIWPDRQMILFAKQVLQQNPGATIIYDVKCTQLLAHAIQEAGGIPLMWKTGHSLVKTKMAETQAKLAGEMSGHIFFNDRWFGFDDGLYAGARLLEILSHAEQSASEIFASIPNSICTPELRIPVSEEQKFSCMTTLIQNAHFKDATIQLIDGLRVEYPFGFGLIRPSNTSPYLIARFEADTEENLKKIQQQFKNLLITLGFDLKLPF